MKPEDVLHNWNVPSLTTINSNDIKRSSSGLLNQTYIIRPVQQSDELYILQCVHPAVSVDGAMNNYFHVTQFLKEQGLKVQTMLQTTMNKLWVEDQNGWRWRLLRGVEGEMFDSTTDLVLGKEAGKILGQFHTMLSQYPKELDIGLPMFRYTHEFTKLQQFETQLMADADESIQKATQLLVTELPKLLLPVDLPQRIIHADPKISNFLFTQGKKGICMIDLDTVQKLSPLYDIGDALRSWCGQQEDDPNNSFNVQMHDAFLEGYLSISKSLLSEREQLLIPQATKLIMLGLATRFLNDYVEDSYFGWDETKYNSRKAHNKARTMGQISLYQSYMKQT